jgi:lipid-A-disaccharide synthase
MLSDRDDGTPPQANGRQHGGWSSDQALKVMIACGEPSGDLYAGALAEEIRRMMPTATIWGLGGERLRKAGADLVGDYRGLSVTGLIEALSVVPRSIGMLRRLTARARSNRPDVLVVIDFPDFNFRLAAAAKRLGVPVVYYICPQIWAWRAGRMAAIKRLVDRAIVIFPFEESLYRDAGVPVEFVGHPLLDVSSPLQSKDVFLRECGLDPDTPTVALLPGSRPNEVKQILPVLLEAAAIVKARLPRTQFLLARAPDLPSQLFETVGNRPSLRVVEVESRTDDVLAASSVALTASGTATVQAAIHGTPMVVVYRLSRLTYALGRRFVRVDTYGMVNLIAGRKVVPELIQEAFTPEAVAEEALCFLTEPERWEAARSALREVRQRLGGPGASRRAAQAVIGVATASRPVARRS